MKLPSKLARNLRFAKWSNLGTAILNGILFLVWWILEAGLFCALGSAFFCAGFVHCFCMCVEEERKWSPSE